MTSSSATRRRGVAVVSTHSDIAPEVSTKSLEEMIFDASTAVLDKAHLSIEKVDAIVLSGYDQSDGRIISCMVSAGPAGGVDKDVTMIASSGEHALIYAYLRLLAGQGENVLVLGWGKPSESAAPDRAQLVSAEPFVLRNIGMNNSIAAALQASVLEGRKPAGDVACWPLSRADLPSEGDAVHAVVMAAEDSAVVNRPTARVAGVGWATGAYELGARRLDSFDVLAEAVSQLVKRGGPDVAEWTSLEVAAPSEPAVRAVVRALGVAPSVRVNGSGSLHAKPTPPHVAGMARMIAAANLAHDEGGCAVGIGMHGFAGQGLSVMAFTNFAETEEV